MPAGVLPYTTTSHAGSADPDCCATTAPNEDAAVDTSSAAAAAHFFDGKNTMPTTSNRQFENPDKKHAVSVWRDAKRACQFSPTLPLLNFCEKTQQEAFRPGPVSYTHLTLPTIYSV